jgi:hypothetical protein
LEGRALLNVLYENEKNAAVNREKVVEAKWTGYRARTVMGGGGAEYGMATGRAGVRNPLNDLLLLPPLRAPNDPEIVEEQERQRREMQKKKLAFHKQNAEATLAAIRTEWESLEEKPTERTKKKDRPKRKWTAKKESVGDEGEESPEEEQGHDDDVEETPELEVASTVDGIVESVLALTEVADSTPM